MFNQQNTRAWAKWIDRNIWFASLMVAVSYIILAEVGYLIAHPIHRIAPIWPPMGLMLAAVFLGHRKLIPAIFVGVVSAQIFGGMSVLASICIGGGASTAAFLCDFIFQRLGPYRSVLGQAFLPLWIVVSGMTVSVVTAAVGTLCLIYVQGLNFDSSFLNLWFSWWIGDSLGAMIVAPVLLMLRPVPLKFEWFFRVILFVILMGLTFMLIFYYGSGAPLLFLVFPLLLLGFFWFGPSGGAWVCLAFVISAVFVAASRDQSGFDYYDQLLLFDSFLIALVVTSLAISSYFDRKNFKLAAILFLIGWSISGWLFYTLKTTATELDEVRFHELVEEAQESVNARLNIYIDALRAAASYQINSSHVSREEWRNYVDYLDMDLRYPGINGIGFIFPFRADELQDYVTQVREEIPDFEIKEVPDVKRPGPDAMSYAHYIITHIEPLAPNAQALGLDTASEINRQHAGARARDLGVPMMTDRIILVQDGKSRPGFLIYYPMYRRGVPINTVEARREAFVGWSYAPFVTELFLKGVLGQRADQIEFSIFDSNAVSEQSFVYSTQKRLVDLKDFEEITQLDLAGQVFTFGWSRGSRFPRQETTSVTVAAASLALGTCFLVGIIISLQTTNRRANEIVLSKTNELVAINHQLQNEVDDRMKAEEAAEQARQIAEEARLVAEQASSAKSDFLATMSHEIRTPMNSVLGFAELLAGTQLDETQRQWTNYIGAAGNTLLRIINDVLDFSKIEARKLTLEHIPFPIKQTVKEVVGSYGVLANEKGIEIEHHIDESMPDQVFGDPVRLMQIINNLNANAMKFTSEGQVVTSLEWKGDQTEGVATIKVRDTGIGIPADKVDQLFEKFTQADSTTTRKFGGTGLGLAICKHLVELMGGEIHAESQLGVGTTVIVTIPFKVSQQAVVKDSKHRVVEPRPRFNIDVLLVDDNTVNQKLGMTVLKRFGCNVALAANGEEAVEAIKAQYYPIIFMDCQMPIMDGFEASRQIRDLERQNRVPNKQWKGRPMTIVALTANASPEDKVKCLSAGMDDYLRKPCKFDDFMQVLSLYAPRG